MGAYILLFGAFWGETTFGHARLLAFDLWILMAVFGSILVGRKNLQISNPQRRWKVTVADLLITVTLLVLINVLPISMGLVRSAIIFLVMVIYLLIYFILLYKGKFVEMNILS
jgi:hypothetical protein